jgi:GNAT superfamily N-acetyltransferase
MLLNYKNGPDVFTVSEIIPADINEVSELLIQLGYNVSTEELINRIEKITELGKGTVFVAKDETNKIIGCVHALLDVRLAGGNFGEVVSLVVDEGFRGKGIGKKLIGEAEAWLRQKGEKRLRIRCNAIRNETHKFYEHLGFVEKKSQKIFEKIIE